MVEQVEPEVVMRVPVDGSLMVEFIDTSLKADRSTVPKPDKKVYLGRSEATLFEAVILLSNAWYLVNHDE